MKAYDKQTNERNDQERFLTFLLGKEEFGVAILRVREIIQYDTISTVPNMPNYIRGVINLRGNIVPVVDLAKRFKLPDSEVTKRTCIVMVEAELNGEQTIMGLMVDAVSQVRGFDAADVEEVPQFGTTVDMQYLRGMGKCGKRLVLLLDVDRVLRAEEVRELPHLGIPKVEKASVEAPAR